MADRKSRQPSLRARQSEAVGYGELGGRTAHGFIDRRSNGAATAAKALLWTVATALLIGGCSLVEFGYRQLDWIMLQRVEELVHLNGQQRRHLRQDIDELLDWHCRTQLPEYTTLLGDLRRDFQHGAITPARAAEYSDRIEGYWYALLDQGTIGGGRLLASLSDRQIEELDADLAKRNREIADELRAMTGEKASRDYAKLAQDHWERWLGALNPRQEQLIDDWSRAFRPLGVTGVDFRDRLRRKLAALVREHRGDPTGMRTGLLRLLAEIRTAPPPDYAELAAANEQLSIGMIAAVAAAADPDQIANLAEVAGGWRTDIAAIDCH